MLPMLLKIKYLMLVIQLKQLTITKVNEIEKNIIIYSDDQYITTPEFNKLTAENVAARLVQANLVTKTDFDDKLKNPNKKVNSNKAKRMLVKNELKTLETFNSIYFRSKSHFEDDVKVI